MFTFQLPCQKYFILNDGPELAICVGSQIFQAWRKFMDEIEQQSKQIRFNAEQLENLCSDRMQQLYQDKRKSRKQYQEEHTKIATQFAHVSHHWPTFPFPRDASTSSENRFEHSTKKFHWLLIKINFWEWERKFRLFIWTWWCSMNRHPRAVHEKYLRRTWSYKNTRRWRRVFNLHRFGADTCFRASRAIPSGPFGRSIEARTQMAAKMHRRMPEIIVKFGICCDNVCCSRFLSIFFMFMITFPRSKNNQFERVSSSRHFYSTFRRDTTKSLGCSATRLFDQLERRCSSWKNILNAFLSTFKLSRRS